MPVASDDDVDHGFALGPAAFREIRSAAASAHEGQLADADRASLPDLIDVARLELRVSLAAIGAGDPPASRPPGPP
jgi:hypothetical protein